MTKVTTSGLHSYLSESVSTLLERCVSEEDCDKLISSLRGSVRESINSNKIDALKVSGNTSPEQSRLHGKISTIMDSM